MNLITLVNAAGANLIPSRSANAVFTYVSATPNASRRHATRIMGRMSGVLTDGPTVTAHGTVVNCDFVNNTNSGRNAVVIGLGPFRRHPNKFFRHVGRTYANNNVRTLFIGPVRCASMLNVVCGRATTVGSTRILTFTPPVVSNFSVRGNVAVAVRSGANNSLGGFFSGIGGFLTRLGGHPRVRATRARCGPGCPRCVISMSITGAGRTNVSPSAMLSIVRNCLNNLCTSGFGTCNGLCHIVVRTKPRDHVHPSSLDGVCIHYTSNAVSPMDRFIGLGGICNPSGVAQFGLFASVSMSMAPGDNCSANSNVGTVTRITGRALPRNCNCRCSNLAHSRTRSDGSANLVFTLYVMFICLVLDTRCRDCVLPLSMMLSVPFNLTNTFVFAGVFNRSGSVCVRVSLVVLVNLLTGGTVLVMRFTLRHHHANVTVGCSTVLNTNTHLHPVLVASLTVVVNLLPLVFTSNMNGGNGRALNTTTMNNVLVNAVYRVFIIPTLFTIFR